MNIPRSYCTHIRIILRVNIVSFPYYTHLSIASPLEGSWKFLNVTHPPLGDDVSQGVRFTVLMRTSRVRRILMDPSDALDLSHSALRASITDNVEDQPTSLTKQAYWYISSCSEVHVVIDSYLLVPSQLLGYIRWTYVLHPKSLRS